MTSYNKRINTTRFFLIIFALVILCLHWKGELYIERLAGILKGNGDLWKGLETRPPPHMVHDKWIVLTTINHPTDDVKKLANIPGWKVVVVGDTKSPSNWR